jgi:hypothetical protein
MRTLHCSNLTRTALMQAPRRSSVRHDHFTMALAADSQRLTVQHTSHQIMKHSSVQHIRHTAGLQRNSCSIQSHKIE